jgi:Tfp pilus assembly protein PilF
LKEAIWLNESSSGAYILLGQIQLKKGDAGLAAGFLERALKLDPQNYYVHYFLAKAYQNWAGRQKQSSILKFVNH